MCYRVISLYSTIVKQGSTASPPDKVTPLFFASKSSTELPTIHKSVKQPVKKPLWIEPFDQMINKSANIQSSRGQGSILRDLLTKGKLTSTTLRPTNVTADDNKPFEETFKKSSNFKLSRGQSIQFFKTSLLKVTRH
jgi:hypothetical protein